MASYASGRMNAQSTEPDSAQAHIGDLSGELFPNHPKTGDWFSLKGDDCKPWEIQTLESTSAGTSRHQAPTMSPAWNSTVVVQTPTTKAQSSDGHYKSDLPNHSGHTK